LTGIFRRFSLR